MIRRIPELIIGELRARVPIVQGGMSVGISLERLASSVADQGGIGVIGAAGIGANEPDVNTNFREADSRALRKAIRRAREMTDGLIGVNIMMALTDYDSLILTAFDEEVDLVFIGTGLLLRTPDTIDMNKLKRAKTKIVPIVSSEKGARVLFNYWARFYDHVPDAVVIEGPLAGGHLGFTRQDIDDPGHSLENIVPGVLNVIRPFEERYKKNIPVIAAGGIFTGADIYKFIRMGASGVQMGTRFVATYECDASMKFKEAYLNCSKEDVVIIDSPVGMPGRAIRNEFIDDVSAGIKKPFQCLWKCLRTCDFNYAPYCIAKALTSAKEGKFEDGFAFAGANAYRIEKIQSVKELIQNLIKEYEAAMEGIREKGLSPISQLNPS